MADIKLEIIKEILRFGDIIFDIFAGIIRKAHISNIPNIFILIAIKILKNIRKNNLYIFTFNQIDLAISSFIIIAEKFFQNLKKNIYIIISKIDNIIISVLFINNIEPNKKLFISKVKSHKNHTVNIAQATHPWDIISFVDSFVIKLVFSIKNIKKLQIIANKNANK